MLLIATTPRIRSDMEYEAAIVPGTSTQWRKRAHLERQFEMPSQHVGLEATIAP